MYRIDVLLKPRSSDSWFVGYFLGMYGQLRTFVPKLFPPAIFLHLPCGKVLMNFFQEGEKNNITVPVFEIRRNMLIICNDRYIFNVTKDESKK